MSAPPGPPVVPRSRRRSRSRWSLRLTPVGAILLLLLNCALLALLVFGVSRFAGWPLVQAQGVSPTTETYPPETAVSAIGPTSSPSPTPTSQPTSSPTSTLPTQRFNSTLDQGVIYLSLSEGGYSHLFAYQPISLPLTRLTDGPWDDITPALSPDQARLAFASNRSGQWDLYLLDLESGALTRLTDTPEYDAAPTWSPDGRYLAYETYTDERLRIVLRDVNGDAPPIPLSDHPDPEFAPAWSPLGRQIAFISPRDGQNAVWLADLDKPGEDRFTSLSQNALAVEAHPVWSPDGSRLAWAAVDNGLHSLYIWQAGGAPRYVGSGDWPAWSPDGRALLTVLLAPNQTMLTAYTLENSVLALPPVALPGAVSGLVWRAAPLPVSLAGTFAADAAITPTPLWLPALTPAADIPNGRQRLVPLSDVQAPYPQLHDMVDESFRALRLRVAAAAGWDLLASLENAYVPITAPLPPGMSNDWLYTGRAFAFTPLPLNAGWIVAVPEDFGAQTYWHIYLRARYQDGSQGQPLHSRPWDFSARYHDDPLAYEQGGVLAQAIPGGYWIDLTSLASAYRWERLPALPTWRSAYSAARFNEFALTDGEDWRTAMLELYPPEALVTPTVILPPTVTPTPTPRWYRSPTPTQTATNRPTFTPPASPDTPTSPATSTDTPTTVPTATPSPSPVTSTPTRTSLPSLTAAPSRTASPTKPPVLSRTPTPLPGP
jgi:TolB protein